MGYAWAYGQIADQLRAEWNETDLAFEGESFPEPNPPRPFVMVEIEGGTARPHSMAGDGRLYTRQPVTVTIDAFAPVAEGAVRPVDLAEAAGRLLARLARIAGPAGPFLLMDLASVSGPWPARGTSGYLNARSQIEGHVDSWSDVNAG